jgi:hypothetical protein
MSKTFLDHGQMVGYDFGTKKLIATVSKKVADKMKADGWTIGYEKDLGYFVSIQLED